MTTQEIKTAGFRLFDATVTAMLNVSNGCFADQQIVDKNMPRLIKMVAWMKENDLIMDLRYYVFSSGKFNRANTHMFSSKLFNSITEQ